MPKVLRIMHRLCISGTTHHAAFLTKYMDSSFDTLFVSGLVDSDEGDGSYIVEEMGIKPTYIQQMKRSINPFQDIKAFWEIRKIIKDFRPDIVDTHAAKAGTLGRLAAMSLGVPIIVHTFHGHVFHSYFGKVKTRIFIEIERFLARKSTKIIAISEKQKRELVEEFRICPSSKIKVIPLGFDLTKFSEAQLEKRFRFRQEFKIEDDTIVVVIAGRLAPIKNHAFFIECMAEVKRQTFKKVIGIIVGGGELKEELIELAHQRGLIVSESSNEVAQPDLIFTSWRFDIDSVFAGADIVAQTSLNEGTPVTLIEAQAAGKPIVSTDVGGIEDIVRRGENALLSIVNDKEGFVSNLRLVIENDEFRHKMVQNTEGLSTRFHYRRLVSDMEHLYNELLTKK